MSGQLNHYIRHAKSNEETRQLWWPNIVREEWNRGPEDLATYIDHNRTEGMLLLFTKDGDTAVGHIAAVVNDNSTGWVALFIITPEFRKQRLGAELWDEMMKDFHTAKTAIVGLDAVPEQVKTYSRRGFVESTIGTINIVTRPLGEKESEPRTHTSQLRSFQEVEPHHLAQYEQQTTGFYRPAMWQSFVKREDVIGVVLVKDTVVSGFTAIRRAPMGIRLGPVYADTASIAEDLLNAACAHATPAYIRQHPMQDYPLHLLDDAALTGQANICAEIWTGNADSKPLFERQGWTEAGVFHRMWLNGKATAEQSEGGQAGRSLFSIFDAAVG